jgi:OOP family OmpA-OmpF porin
MRRSVLWVSAALALAAVGVGCGRARPQVPPTVFVQQTPTCREQWVHMPVLLNFPTGGTVLDATNEAILDEMVRSGLTRNDIVRVRVEGHADTCGNEINNMALSQGRAASIANELMQMGVPADRIETIGYGSTQPRAEPGCSADMQLSMQTNRRVEFSLLVCR